MSNPISQIEVKNLTIGYKNPKVNIVVGSNINFSIVPKQLVGIIGANGEGKSTLLKTIARLENPLSGNISINQKSINNYNINEISKKIAFVSSKNILHTPITVYHYVSLGRQPYTNWLDLHSKEDRYYINKAIKLAKIEHLKNKKCTELSDGQLQKVAIARALAQNTSIILFDEPTSHLDIKLKIEIFTLLKQLTISDSKTILFTSHEIEFTLKICDSIICIHNKSAMHYTTQSLLEKNIINTVFATPNIHFNNTNKSFEIRSFKYP